jgi:hypothetical protein
MADSFGGQAGGLGGVVAAFGGSDAAPKPKYYQGSLPLLRGVSGVGRDVLANLRAQLPSFYSNFAQGTEQQRGLQGEQEQVLRTLLNRRLNSNPQQQLQETGNTLFSFINPNVVSPLARFDVNYNNALRTARGLNPSTFDSTSERLRNARIASGRYYDVARDVYGQLPRVYQQLRDAGVTDEMLAAGAIPQIQQGYRTLDLAPLIPLQASLGVAREAAGIPADYGAASRANIYGFRQPMNLADRFGAAGQSMWNTVKDAAAIYSSLYGGGALGGGGGGLPTGGGGDISGYGSLYRGAGGNPYISLPTEGGGGASYPILPTR